MSADEVHLPAPVLPREVHSARLRLRMISSEEASAMLAGHREPSWHADYPRKDDLDAASMVAPGDTWGPRHVVRAVDGLVVGGIGFFGAPQPASDGVLETEVGFGLVHDARGRGVASEALRALLAEADRLRVRIRARVLPENSASVRVLAKAGFTELRGSTEDGELVMARPLS